MRFVSMRQFPWLCMVACASFVACADDAGTSPSGLKIFDPNASNPLAEEETDPGKADTQYYNPDGVEIEVDLEADIDAPASRKMDGPAVLGQFALTHLRKTKEVYLESLAEQATNAERVEWFVDGAWKTAREAASLASTKLVKFRIRGINAVLLNGARTGAAVGKVFEVPVPTKPFSLMADAGDSCAEHDDHMALDQSVYWYLWEPTKAGCKATTQKMKVTIAKMLPSKVTYPEYDQLVADGKVTMVFIFGQIDDELSKSETGYLSWKQMGTWLLQGGFKEVKPAPVGRRFQKTVNNILVEVDAYSPYDFAGLDDYAHFDNFQKALSEHEIISYDGHSMLGASDFWSRPKYPKFYQVFLYGGCLGYEYYIAPILAGKGGNWQNLDMLSAVVEVTATSADFSAPFLSKLMYTIKNGYKLSWKDMLGAIRTRVGDSTFGMSGVRDNCFTPNGSACTSGTPDRTAKTYNSTAAVPIPDNNATGASSKIDVKDDFVMASASVRVKITHPYIGDVLVTLEKDAVKKTLFDGSGVGTGLDQTFQIAELVGKNAKGVWTLKVVDREAEDAGTIDSWTITATPK